MALKHINHGLFALVFTTLLSCTNQQTQNFAGTHASIPTAQEVGAHALPQNIVPVTAPFKTISFKKPIFPGDSIVLSLMDKNINTISIQSSVDQLSEKGGGTIVIPQGDYLTGRIQLKDNINLHLSEGAILRFSAEIKDFLPVVFTRIEGIEVMSLGACIYANGATNIAITGNGKLIGPGEGSIRERIMTTQVIDDVIDPKTPVKERIVDGKATPWIFPPMFIAPINCNQVYIENISLENTAFWNIVPTYCNNVIIRGVTINSVGVPRGDGIDVESSTNVLIEYCTLSCGDDCFTIKAGRGLDGLRVGKPTKNVVVRYCLALHGHGGITCGSETAGMIRNLYVHDCVFNDVGVGIRFKTRRPRGGGGEYLTFERIRLNLRYTAIKWDMLGSSAYVGELANRLPARAVNALTPKYENIHIKDIIIEKATHFVKVIGIPEMPVNYLRIENVDAHCTALIDAKDLKNAEFKNMHITSQDSAIHVTDSKSILFSNIRLKGHSSPVRLFVNGENSDSIKITNCENMEDLAWYAASKNK